MNSDWSVFPLIERSVTGPGFDPNWVTAVNTLKRKLWQCKNLYRFTITASANFVQIDVNSQLFFGI